MVPRLTRRDDQIAVENLRSFVSCASMFRRSTRVVQSPLPTCCGPWSEMSPTNYQAVTLKTSSLQPSRRYPTNEGEVCSRQLGDSPHILAMPHNLCACFRPLRLAGILQIIAVVGDVGGYLILSLEREPYLARVYSAVKRGRLLEASLSQRKWCSNRL